MTLRRHILTRIDFMRKIILLWAWICVSHGISNLCVRAADPAPTEQRVVKFWHPYTQPQRAAEMRRSAAEFEKLHPDVKVEIEIVPWANIHQRWRAAHLAGELPDVGLGNPPDYLDMWQAGAIHDVEDVIASL